MKRVAGAVLLASVPFNSIQVIGLMEYPDVRSLIAGALSLIILASALMGFDPSTDGPQGK